MNTDTIHVTAGGRPIRHAHHPTHQAATIPDIPVTAQDFTAMQQDAMLREARARLARAAAPDAASWETNPRLVVDDLIKILGTDPPPPVYPSLGRFVDGFLTTHYSRQVRDTNFRAWCPEWWEHEEAMFRFGLLWRGFEEAHACGSTRAMDDWTLHSLIPHMSELLDPKGAFEGCHARHGHRPPIEGKPMTSAIAKAPAGLFA